MRCFRRSAGRPALNLSVELAEAGVLDKYGVELIGAKIESIKKAEDRLLFKDAMRKIGLDTPYSQLVNSVEGGVEFAERIGYPGDSAAQLHAWAARAAGSLTTAKNWKRFWSAASIFRRFMKC